MEKLYREIKTTTINSEVVSYRMVSLLQIFELINIIEDTFYNSIEKNKVKNLPIEKRIDSLRSLVSKYSNTDNPIEFDLQLLINKDSRDRLVNLLNEFYVDIDVEKVSGKVYFLLANFLNQQVFTIDINVLLQ